MDFLDLVKMRFSVRQFKEQDVELDKIRKILEAAQAAPTACNNQPQRILVLDTSTALEKVKECTRFHFNAPLNFLVCYDQSVSWVRSLDHHDEGPADAAIVATHMMLEAVNEGLGNTWVGSFDPTVAKRVFSLPESWIPVVFLPTGYPAAPLPLNSLHHKRSPLEETVLWPSGLSH